MITKLEGVNGVLELYEDKIILKREGVFSKMAHGFTKGDKTIYIRNIMGIDFKRGGSFVNGFLEFTVAGGLEQGGGIMDAVSDENSIVIRQSQNEKAEKVVTLIEEIQKNYEEPVDESFSVADELIKLQALLDDQVINKQEFEKLKNDLIN